MTQQPTIDIYYTDSEDDFVIVPSNGTWPLSPHDGTLLPYHNILAEDLSLRQARGLLKALADWMKTLSPDNDDLAPTPDRHDRLNQEGRGGGTLF